MRKIVFLILVSFLSLSAVKANLRDDTNELKNRIETELSDFNSALSNFNNYLNTNKTLVINALDNETLKDIGDALEANNYEEAFRLLETKVNDPNLTNLHMNQKINNYFALKADLIEFANSNKTELSIITGDEYLDCSLTLYNQMKASFDTLKPTIKNTIEKIGQILAGYLEKVLDENKNVETNELAPIIAEYKELGKIVGDLGVCFDTSIADYKSLFEVIGGNEELFNIVIKRKIDNDLKEVLDELQESLKASFDAFINTRWYKLETEVNTIAESDKTTPEKNEDIYEKINQVESVNEVFVNAINEVIDSLDIDSLKAKLNAILKRGSDEFSDAIKYLEDHMFIDDYDINLVANHDADIIINRAREILILDKLFTVEEFKRQIELATAVGTLEFDTKDYTKVPNKAKVIVTDNDQIQKEYDVIVKGDINGNSAITVTDVILAAYASLDSIELDELEELAADINSNGKITVTDVYLIAVQALEGGQ